MNARSLPAGPSSPGVTVRALYEAINARDYEAGFALLADDFEWLEPRHGLLGGPHRGVEGVRRAIEMQLEVFDEFTIEAEEFHEHGDRIAVPIRQRARGARAASSSRSASGTCGPSGTGRRSASRSSPPARTRARPRRPPSRSEARPA